MYKKPVEKFRFICKNMLWKTIDKQAFCAIIFFEVDCLNCNFLYRVT